MTKSKPGPLIAVAVVLLLLVLYGAGYFLLGDTRNWDGRITYRIFSARWQTIAFVPAAHIETKLTGCSVSLHIGTRWGTGYSSTHQTVRLAP